MNISKSNVVESFNLNELKYNEIIYGMNPECLNNYNKTESKYCPNQHPNIPCNLIGCQESNSKLTNEMKKYIYMYTYLTGLIKATQKPE